MSHWPSSYISFLISLVIPDIWHFSNSTYVVYICIHKHFNNVCLNSPFFIVSMYILLFIHVSLLLNVDKGRYEMFKKNCIYKLIFFYLYLYQLSILIHEELQMGSSQIISLNFCVLRIERDHLKVSHYIFIVLEIRWDHLKDSDWILLFWRSDGTIAKTTTKFYCLICFLENLHVSGTISKYVFIQYHYFIVSSQMCWRLSTNLHV